jgi:hypothetical protein
MPRPPGMPSPPLHPAARPPGMPSPAIRPATPPAQGADKGTQKGKGKDATAASRPPGMPTPPMAPLSMPPGMPNIPGIPGMPTPRMPNLGVLPAKAASASTAFMNSMGGDQGDGESDAPQSLTGVGGLLSPKSMPMPVFPGMSKKQKKSVLKHGAKGLTVKIKGGRKSKDVSSKFGDAFDFLGGSRKERAGILGKDPNKDTSAKAGDKDGDKDSDPNTTAPQPSPTAYSSSSTAYSGLYGTTSKPERTNIYDTSAGKPQPEKINLRERTNIYEKTNINERNTNERTNIYDKLNIPPGGIKSPTERSQSSKGSSPVGSEASSGGGSGGSYNVASEESTTAGRGKAPSKGIISCLSVLSDRD